MEALRPLVLLCVLHATCISTAWLILCRPAVEWAGQLPGHAHLCKGWRACHQPSAGCAITLCQPASSGACLQRHPNFCGRPAWSLAVSPQSCSDFLLCIRSSVMSGLKPPAKPCLKHMGTHRSCNVSGAQAPAARCAIASSCCCVWSQLPDQASTW